jgi:hypothetical protein
MRRCAHTNMTRKRTEINHSPEVLQDIRGLKFGKSPGPNGIPSRVLRHLPKRDNLFHESVKRSPPQAILPISMETRPRGVHTEAGKDPTLPSSYRPIILLDTVDKLFE